MESLFLHDLKNGESYVSQAGEKDPKQAISQYNDSLDALLIASEKEKPLSVIGRLAASLPDNILFELIKTELDQSPSLSFKGTITAENIDDFSSSLKNLVENLNNNFSLSNPISIDDVEIEMPGTHSKNGRQNYHVSFNLDLT